MVKLNGESFDVVEDNISKLKEIFPEVVNGDNQIDFDSLRNILENDIEVVDDGEEHYKFTWWGKKESKRKALESTTKTLRPSIKDSKNWNETENIYIEGDNLDALKILLGSYRNRIKMIYIDPPYNTGKDFIYHDNRTETELEHLESTNQLNEDGQLLENPRTEGKYHSNWLSMMYPRLNISRKFLTDDGLIFISIGDDEVGNLRKLCDEIFGENNFLAEISRNSTAGSKNDSNLFINDNDYILVYSKNINKVLINKQKRKNTQRYPKKDEFGEFKLRALEMQGGSEDALENRPKMGYSIYYNPKTEDYKLLHDYDLNKTPVYEEPSKDLLENGYICVRPKKQKGKLSYWRWSKETFLEKISEIYIDVEKCRAYSKDRKKEFLEVSPNCNIKILNTAGTTEISSLFGEKVFSFPKPVELIEYLLKIGSCKDSLILDFFSGSSTTAHSIFKLNGADGGNRKFIMIQIPEKVTGNFSTNFENICEIGKERIRRAGDKIHEEYNNKDLDIGFKVFKIDESNFIPWNPKLETTKEVEQAILGTANNLVQGRSELDLVYELLLQLNLDLNAKIEETKVNNHKFYVVNDGFLLICLDSNIDETIAKDIINLKEELMTEYCKVILLDKALNALSSINIFNDLDSENIELDTI